MSMLNREGVFHAYPVEIGIDETGGNNLATCIVRYQVFQERIDGFFDDISDEGAEITPWYYLEKKDGSINDFTVNALKEAFAWDGRDAFWLQDTDLAEHAVQITTAFETYNNTKRLKVQWTNPFGSECGGGVTKADNTTRTAIKNRIGAKLRALAGGTPANAKPATGAPSTPPKRSAPVAAAAVAAGVFVDEAVYPDATIEEAWEPFAKACNKQWTQTDCEQEWFRVIDSMFHKPSDQLTPADWGRMKADGAREIIPV